MKSELNLLEIVISKRLKLTPTLNLQNRPHTISVMKSHIQKSKLCANLNLCSVTNATC